MEQYKVNELYEKAYKLHYKEKNYSDAYFYYNYILKIFPNTKEANYATQQIKNIESMNVLTAEMINLVNRKLEEPYKQMRAVKDQERRKSQNENILITTGYNFEMYDISEYLDVVSNPVVIGTGFLSSLGASFADLTGTRSGTYENKLEKAEKLAVKGLKEQAKAKGANGIIGIDVDYTSFTADVMGVIVSGTAVKLRRKKETPQNENFVFPNTMTNRKASFNVCTTEVVYNYLTEEAYGKVVIKNYDWKRKLVALELKLKICTIFGEEQILDNMIYTIHSEGIMGDDILISNPCKFLEKNIRWDIVKYIDVNLVKCLYDDNEIIEFDRADDFAASSEEKETSKAIKKYFGEDAICNMVLSGAHWICCCGNSNEMQAGSCTRCGRIKAKNISDKVSSYNEAANFEDLIQEIKGLGSAKEIAAYISINTIVSSEIIEKVQGYAKKEALYGNMKDDAIRFIENQIG